MSIGVIVEVAIGVLFVWVLLALITSQASDWAASIFNWRAEMLEKSIRTMLGCEAMCTDFYKHPLIKGLHSNEGRRKPSYVPNNQFALVVFDIFMKAGTDESQIGKAADELGKKGETTISQIKKSIENISQRDNDDKKEFAKAIDTLLIDVSNVEKKGKEADEALAQARKRMEAWFDNAMERLSGSYKRRAQLAAVIIGVVVAAIINADSLAIAEALWTQPLVREAVVAQAEQLQLPEEQGTNPQDQILDYASTLQGFSLPVGWTADNIPTDFNGWFLKVGGILVSGAAAAQGAPFWFEVLRKLLNFRSNPVPKKEES